MESSCFQEDGSPQDEAVQGLEPGQDTQTPLEGGTAVSAPIRNTQSWGEMHTGQAKEQKIPVKQFMKQSHCTSDQSCLFLQQILWNPIDFKLNSPLVYGGHPVTPEIPESFTCNLTESFLVSLLMINSTDLERKILPALPQAIPFLVNSKAIIHSDLRIGLAGL